MITLLLTLLLAPASPAAAVTSTQLLADARAHITEITPEKAKSQLEGKAVVLDVREPDEFAAGHLPGAINIPRGRLEFAAEDKLKDPKAPIVVYCASGHRSALATRTLNDLGYKNAVSMNGGYKAWTKAGYATEK